MVDSVWFPSLWHLLRMVLEGQSSSCGRLWYVSTATRDGSVAGCLCWSYVNLRLKCIIFKVSLSLGLEITCCIVGEAQHHIFTQWKYWFLGSCSYLPLVSWVTGQDSESLSPWFSHLWTGDGIRLPSLWEGQMKLNGGRLWEKLDPNPNSTIILGEVFIQRHVGKKQYSL